MNPVLWFLVGCLPVRIALCLWVQRADSSSWPTLAVVLGGVGLAFVYLYLTSSRMMAPEAGGPTWWKEMRWLHGLLYLTAALYVVQGKPYAWIPLCVDVLLGSGLVFLHHRCGLDFY